MNYDKFDLTDEEFKEGISNFFTQLLIEAKRQKKRGESYVRR